MTQPTTQNTDFRPVLSDLVATYYVKDVYGMPYARYPINNVAKFIAKLSGNKTLTDTSMRLARERGIIFAQQMRPEDA